MLNSFKSVSMLLLLGGVATGMASAVPAVNVVSAGISQQAASCRGIVKDQSGEAIIGASVVVKGTTQGTITGIDGDFEIPNVEKGTTIQISFVSYQTVEVVWDGKDLNVVMKEDTQQLEEVVVVAFGTQKKVNVTGAVSSVSAKELSARPVNSVTDALQGVVPGMNFSTGDAGGALTGSTKFNIRGTGTIGSGSSVEPLVLIDGMEGDMNTLNPQDIESISVLKDAAASSIYGSRAPGGVVLITTKKGKQGKVSVNYNNNFRIVSPLNLPEMVDSYNFALAINDQMKHSGHAPMYDGVKLQNILDYQAGKDVQYMWPAADGTWNSFDDNARLGVMPAGNTDWMKFHFGNSFTQEHSLSLSGGGEKTQFYLSANYLNQGGLLNYGDDSKQRYSLTAKINSDITKWLKLGYSVRFNRTDVDTPSFASGDIWNNQFYFDVCRYWPVIPAIDPNGYYTDPSKVYNLTQGGRAKTQKDVLAQQLSLVIEPIKDWRITAELNYRINTSFDHTDRLTTYTYDVEKNPRVSSNAISSVSEYAYKSNFFNPNIFTEYGRMFGDGHDFKVMAGFQSEIYKDRSITASKDGVMSNIPTLNTTQDNPQNLGGYGNWATVGFFGRINYNYKERYLAEVNMRYDGTSRFLRENRWNVFPSFSLGWNIAREKFFERYNHIFQTLKLRGSWGELGNQNTDNWYPFYRTMKLNENAWGGYSLGSWLVNGMRPNISAEGALVSSLLTWERTQTLDIGFDLGMLNNRLTVNFDYFQRKSLDMVGPAPELPSILGIGVPKVNNLDMTSKGWEVQVSWRDQIRDFKYGVTLNLSDSQVTIDKYPNPSNSILDANNSNMYYEGFKLGQIWGFETVGIAQTDEQMNQHLASLGQGGQDVLGSNWAAGDIMYKDLDGKPGITRGDKTLANHGDMKIIGNSTPRYNFGLNLDAAWKGFDLKLFFQGVLKRDYMPNGSSTMFWGAVGYWQTNFFTPHMDYFRNDPESPLGMNLDAYYPRPMEDGKNRNPQTRYLQNAAYCRLKNVTLGYTLPQHLTQKIFINNLRFFVSAENLFTITGLADTFDPETIGVGYWDGCTYPLSKTFSFGLSATF